MKLTITGRHFDTTPALKSYVENKFIRLERYASDIISVHVILQMERKNALVEVNFKLKRFALNVKETDKDMYSAIDKVVDIVKKQLVRHEEKLKGHRRKENRR